MNLRLIKKLQENPDTTSFLFKPEEALNYRPGQFLRYHISDPARDDRGENRFFSIASAPFENIIQLTTKFIPGNGSTFKKDLQKLNLGDNVEVFGPSGHFSTEETDREYVFIAGGIGITPFRSILLDLDHQGKPLNVTLLYANRTANPLFKNEFEVLAKKHPEFKIYYILSEELTTESQQSDNIRILPGKVDKELLRSLISNPQSQIFYISGPEPMVLNFEEMLKNMGVPKENTKRDYFPGYENY